MKSSESSAGGATLFVENNKLPIRNLDDAAASAQLIFRPDEIRAKLDRFDEAKIVDQETLMFEFSV